MMTISKHIEVDDNRVARIAGSRMKIIDLVMEKTANDLGPDELHQNFPSLSLAAIYAAFAYYYDHKNECEAQINASLRFADEMRAANPEGPFVTRMRMSLQ